ncbi:hypothetical protein FACS1894193_10450 [Bacilli bacterium]|nr:hypothetical protein FACS1894193_10450 [Bacilli bacterium]
MNKIKNILNSRGLFYWILIIGTGVKVLDIYLATKQMFYLEHILQGFLLTVLLPAFLMTALMGFASFIDNKWLCYIMLLVVAAVEGSILFLGILYYRLEKNFIFFPNKVLTINTKTTVKGTLFGQIQVGDLIFASDLIIALLVLVSVVLLNRQTSLTSDVTEILEESQKTLSTIRLSLDQVKEKLSDQAKLLTESKASNDVLKGQNNELLEKRAELQDKCRNSQLELQKELTYCKTENDHLRASLAQLEAEHKHLDAEQLQKKDALKAAQAIVSQNTETQAVVEQKESEQQDRLERAQQIAQQVYEEMKERSQRSRS